LTPADRADRLGIWVWTISRAFDWSGTHDEDSLPLAFRIAGRLVFGGFRCGRAGRAGRRLGFRRDRGAVGERPIRPGQSPDAPVGMAGARRCGVGLEDRQFRLGVRAAFGKPRPAEGDLHRSLDPAGNARVARIPRRGPQGALLCLAVCRREARVAVVDRRAAGDGRLAENGLAARAMVSPGGHVRRAGDAALDRWPGGFAIGAQTDRSDRRGGDELLRGRRARSGATGRGDRPGADLPAGTLGRGGAAVVPGRAGRDRGAQRPAGEAADGGRLGNARVSQGADKAEDGLRRFPAGGDWTRSSCT